MRGPGILWMLQTAAGLSMAGPMFFLGIESLRTGQYAWAVGYLTLGALVCYLPTYLIDRIGGPRAWIRRRLSRSGSGTETSADESDTSLEADDGPGSADGSATADDGRAAVFDRFRR